MPRLAGAKAIEKATLPCGATFTEPLGGVKTKSLAFAPFTATVVIVSAVVLVLLTTTEIAGLVVFTICVRKSMVAGEMLMPCNVPTPARATW